EVDVRLSERAGHARQIVQEQALDGYTGICLVGGDGTLHEVVSGLMARGEAELLPLGIIPGGTGNDVARHLGITDAGDGTQRILTGRTEPFDVARVTAGEHTDFCTTIVAWNAVANVNRVAEL